MQKGKRGRPTKKSPPDGGRVSLGLRVTPAIKGRLDKAAAINGRSQSQEAELRLERSFEKEERFHNSARDIYGGSLAGVLLAVGQALTLIGDLSHYSVTFNQGEGPQVRRGTWDESGGQTASQAASILIEILANPDASDKTAIFTGANVPISLLDTYNERAVSAVWLTLRGLAGQPGAGFDEDWEPLRTLLGSKIDRLKTFYLHNEEQTNGHRS